MQEVIRKRTIRPSTRLKTSGFYRVSIVGLTAADILIVEINHESNPFNKTYKFKGSDVLKKKSLGFKVIEQDGNVHINWISTQPING